MMDYFLFLVTLALVFFSPQKQLRTCESLFTVETLSVPFSALTRGEVGEGRKERRGEQREITKASKDELK